MYVRPKQPFVSTALDNDIVLSPADILEDTHPCVRANPELFEPLRPTVEQATANPGERRNVRRG